MKPETAHIAFMPRSRQKTGALAAFGNAAVALAMLFVVFVLIGPAALSDRTVLEDLARHNPAPILIQDGLKFAAVAAAVLLIRALDDRLSPASPVLMKPATVFGLLSAALLLLNAVLSLMAVSQAAGYIESADALNDHWSWIIGVLALAIVFTNGLWYILLSSAALKTNRLPRFLCYLGLAMGLISLLPVLGIVVFLLSVVWSMWLGMVLLRE